MTDSLLLDPEPIPTSGVWQLDYRDDESLDLIDADPIPPSNVKQLYLQNSRLAGNRYFQKNLARVVLRHWDESASPRTGYTVLLPGSISATGHGLLRVGDERSRPSNLLEKFWKRCKFGWRNISPTYRHSVRPDIDPDEILQFLATHGTAPVLELWSKLQLRISDDALQTVAETLSEVIPGSIEIAAHGRRENELSDSFLFRARRLDEHDQTDAALDLIYDQIDELMRNQEFEQLDELVNSIDVGRFSTDLLLGLLTATLPARSRLPSRKEFFKTVKDAIDRRGENEDGLLTGLES